MNNQDSPDLRELIRMLTDSRKTTLERPGSVRSLMLTLEDLEATFVAKAREEGATWDEIATAMRGVTRPTLESRHGTHGQDVAGDG